ncbi:MAG: hypothetical protein WBL99_03810 [Candidatus Acidiferrales bacterium]
MKILVTFALETECAPWRRLRSFSSVAGTAFPIHESAIGDANVRVVLTGVGPTHAKRVAAEALKWHPDICISSGLAGSLRPELGLGEVFVAREVRELEGGGTIACSAELFAAARKRGIGLAERLLSTCSMVLTVEGKARLGYMAEAVDMESFSVLTEAAAFNIPAIAIRAISDSADEDLPMDFQIVLDSRGNLDRSKVARALVRAPQKLPGLVRLGRNSRRAAVNLAKFLDAYVAEISMRPVRQTELVEANQR